MTEDEIMQRAREAVIAELHHSGSSAQSLRSGEWDDCTDVLTAARALRDASKPLAEVLPVDPDVLLAKEIAADQARQHGWPKLGDDIAAGRVKTDVFSTTALAAIKAARKQEAGK